MGFWCFLFVLVATAIVTEGLDQSWSHQAYKDKSYSLVCETDKATLTAADVITWNRHGMDEPLTSGDHFELRTQGGVPNAELLVKKVTDDTKGIYICHVHNSGQMLVDSVVQGLNVGPHLYEDEFDKYREHLIIGVIAGACVFVFILSVGLINQFRYLSEDSLEKRRQRKEQRLHHLQINPWTTSYENGGAEMTETT